MSYRLVYFLSFISRIVLDWNTITKRNETFDLILSDNSVGSQESGQRAAMQRVMSAGGGWGGGGRGAGGVARAGRVAPACQFKLNSSVSSRFVSFWYSDRRLSFSIISFHSVSCR